MSEAITKSLLDRGLPGIAILALVAALVWVVRMREKDRLDCDAAKATQHEDHKRELRENAKALAALLERTLSAIDRLFDRDEARRP